MDSNGTGDPEREIKAEEEQAESIGHATNIGIKESKSVSDVRSGSQPKSLSGHVSFYEQVWQGSPNPNPNSSENITRVERAEQDITSAVFQINESVLQLERELEEKRKGRAGGSEHGLEKVKLRKSQSREYLLHSSTFSTSSHGYSMSREDGAPSPAFLRKNTVPYEDVLESSLEKDRMASGSVKGGGESSNIDQGSRSPSISKTTVTHSIQSQTTVVIKKSETKSLVGPGRSSIKHEAFRGLEPWEGSSSPPHLQHLSPGPESSQSKILNKIAKYEFLSGRSDGAGLRSRTPSGDTTLSSKSYATTSSRLGSPFELTPERSGTSHSMQTSMSEISSFHSAQSPTNLSSLSEPSRVNMNRSTDANLHVLRVSSPSSHESDSSKIPSQVSGTTHGTKIGATVLRKVARPPLGKEKSCINSPDSVEWYSEYKSKFGKNFELGVPTGAKTRTDFIDSHIAEAKGKK
jgi:hypothetical protein